MKTLSTFLQHDYFENLDSFISTLKDEVSFKPAGVLVHSISLSDSELWYIDISIMHVWSFTHLYRNEIILLWYFDSTENESTSQFEIYHVHISNAESKYFNEYYRRLQHFVIWYIDGASYVDLDDERWNYFIMYEYKY